MSLEVSYFCSWWGSSHLGVSRMLREIADAGYDGVEIGIPDDQDGQDELRAALAETGLEVIAHQYAFVEGDYASYEQAYLANLERAAAFEPILINSHTGSDGWSFERNKVLVEQATAISARSGIPIMHETHRGRFLQRTGEQPLSGGATRATSHRRPRALDLRRR